MGTLDLKQCLLTKTSQGELVYITHCTFLLEQDQHPYSHDVLLFFIFCFVVEMLAWQFLWIRDALQKGAGIASIVVTAA